MGGFRIHGCPPRLHRHQYLGPSLAGNCPLWARLFHYGGLEDELAGELWRPPLPGGNGAQLIHRLAIGFTARRSHFNLPERVFLTAASWANGPVLRGAT